MDDRDKELDEANSLLFTGAGIGLVGALSFAIAGAVCPVCVVATPAMLAIGAVKRLRAKRRERVPAE